MSGQEARSSSRLTIWFEEDAAVAAAWYGGDGYLWCQAWPSENLADAAVDAAARWQVSPQTPPPWRSEIMGEMLLVTWLRCVLPLAGDRRREDTSVAAWGSDGPVSAEDAAALVVGVVSGGLDRPATLTTLAWPSLRVAHVLADPDPEMALRTKDAVRAERQAQERPSRLRAAPPAEPDPAVLLAEARAAVVEQYAGRSMTEPAFVLAVLEGAEHHHLAAWADALVEAARSIAVDSTAAVSMHHLLTKTIALRRTPVSPFDGILEAPAEIGRLYDEYAAATSDLTRRRDSIYEGLIHDVASRFFRHIGRPLVWSDLIEQGAWPIKPEAPDPDDY